MDSFKVPRLRIACVGGGPAGIYFSILMKLASPASHVTVLERNPAGVTGRDEGGCAAAAA